MSLYSDLNEVLTPYAQKIKNLKADLGDLSGLETTNKSSIVDAINEAAQSGGGGAIVITDSSEMKNTSQIYLYEGTESGYATGHFYYYNGSAWTDGGLYYVGKDGKNGTNGANGMDGADGQDGFSPIATVEATSTGVKISITDKTETTSATVQNGTATDAQVAAWLEAHPEATTTVQDGAISKSKLASDVLEPLEDAVAGVADLGAEYIYEGVSSDNVDININTKLGNEGFVIGEKYNILTGETETSANENRTILIRVKPGSRVQPRSKNNVKSIVCFNRFGEFVSGFTFANQDAYTIPDDIWYIGLTGGSGFTASGSYYQIATTDYWVTNFYIRTSLRTETDDSFERPGIAADSFAVGYKKLSKNFVYTLTESENIDLRFIKKAPDITSDTVYDGYGIDSTTGEMVEATANVFKKTFYVKPGSKLKLVSGSPIVCLYDYDMKYIGMWARSNVDLEIVIPNEAHYMRMSVGGRLFDQYSREAYARLVTNCLVDDARLYYKDLVVDLSDNNKADISQYLTDNTTEFERKLMYKTIKASNRMRGGMRIASFNIFGTGGKGQSNWDALKELFQEEGIEIVGMQEVQDPLGETEGNRVFSDVMSGWHLKSFSNAVSFMSNSRILATTGDFEIVSSEEVKYTDQTGYGNRHYVRNEVRLPLFNDKKWSDHLKMSVYNTQLEIHRTYGPRQAAELMAAVQNDPNPFIVVLGDFNDESMFSKPVFDVFTNAGLTPVVEDYFSSSTESSGRSLVDNIFVSSRIRVLGHNIIYSGNVKYLQGGVLAPISDHDMVIGDLQLDYSDIITVKPLLTNCSLSGIDNWFSRNDEPITITVVPDDGYAISSIEVGDGEWLSTNANYPDGVVAINGNTITIDPSGVCTDMYIRATATAS